MKILLAINATNFNKELLQFPIDIVEQANAELTAFFLENLTTVYVPFSKYGHLAGYQLSEKENNVIRKEPIENNIEVYKQVFTESGLSGSYTKARGVPNDKTIEASRFADLLLMSDDFSFVSNYEKEPTKFAEEVLTHE
jgi:hypothetical protein